MPIPVDVSPLVPVMNGAITALASIATAAVPVITWYVIAWLRAHGLALSQQAAAAIADRVDHLGNMAVQYGQAAATKSTAHLDLVHVDNPVVAAAASYAIAQAPGLLKDAGWDVTTQAGQQAVVRLVTARLPSTSPVQA